MTATAFGQALNPTPIKDETSNIQNHPLPMDPITLLTRSGGADLTPEEDAQLTQELAAAYHMDEAAATSRDVQRIAEKVRARMDNPPSNPATTGRL